LSAGSAFSGVDDIVVRLIADLIITHSIPLN